MNEDNADMLFLKTSLHYDLNYSPALGAVLGWAQTDPTRCPSRTQVFPGTWYRVNVTKTSA